MHSHCFLYSVVIQSNAIFVCWHRCWSRGLYATCWLLALQGSMWRTPHRPSNLMVAAHDSFSKTGHADFSCRNGFKLHCCPVSLFPVWEHHTKSSNLMQKAGYWQPDQPGSYHVIPWDWTLFWYPSVAHQYPHQPLFLIGLGRGSSTRALSSCSTTGGVQRCCCCCCEMKHWTTGVLCCFSLDKMGDWDDWPPDLRLNFDEIAYFPLWAV